MKFSNLHQGFGFTREKIVIWKEITIFFIAMADGYRR